MNITAVVLTLNEADFIHDCIASVMSVTEHVLVMDSGSTDGTPEIARRLGATVVERPWSGFPQSRNDAFDRCSESPWVLFLDADERVSPELAREIGSAVGNAEQDTAGFWIPRKNIICGRTMRGGGWWPDFQLRLLKPDRCRYPEQRPVHEIAHCDGSTFALSSPLLHLNYRTWREFARKQMGFAALAASHGPRPHRKAYVGGPVRHLNRRFFNDSGYRDGLIGLLASGILSASEVYRVWLGRNHKS